MAEAYWRRTTTLDDYAQVESFRAAFIDGGLTLRPLIRAVLASDEYRAGGLGPGATTADEESRTVRLLSADLLESVVEDLTGYRWTWDGYDMLGNDTYGFRVLAGGVDGETVTSAQADAGMTMVLVLQRVSEGAAAYAVETELEGGGEPRLFTQVTLDSRPGDADFTAQLDELHARLYGDAPDADRRAEDEALWSAIEAQSGAAEAWKGLVSALLRDPRFLGY